MRRTGFFGVLFLGIVAIVAGIVGYQAGVASGAASSGGTVVVAGWFPGFGFLFFFLFIGFVFFAVAGRRRGPWGSGYGRGPWADRTGPGDFGRPDGTADPRRQWIADVHRSLHEDDKATGRPAEDNPVG